MVTVCIECGEELVPERAELGYEYCTKKQCQSKHYRGITVTAIGVNKSADSFIIGDEDEIRRRAEAGEFAKKDSSLGIDYRRPVTGAGAAAASQPRQPSKPSEPSRPRRSSVPGPPQASPRRTWTAEQEKIVRLYHDMGLTPRQIVERARANTPKLGITEALVTKIMCAPPRRLNDNRGRR